MLLHLTIPIPALIVVLCALGWLICALLIGPEKPKVGTYGFDLMTPFVQFVNLVFWVIAVLASLLAWETFK
jgi:hypothetical protein